MIAELSRYLINLKILKGMNNLFVQNGYPYDIMT